MQIDMSAQDEQWIKEQINAVRHEMNAALVKGCRIAIATTLMAKHDHDPAVCVDMAIQLTAQLLAE